MPASMSFRSKSHDQEVAYRFNLPQTWLDATCIMCPAARWLENSLVYPPTSIAVVN